MRPPARSQRNLFPVAQAHRSPVVAASRLSSFQSQTRTGTVAGRFPAPCGQSQLRFRVPARIALRGGERAGAVAICPCPPQEESRFGDLSGRSTAPGPAASGLIAPDLGAPGLEDRLPSPAARRAAHTQPPLRHTHRCVLAEPSYHIKNRGRGQLFPARKCWKAGIRARPL